MIKTNKQMKKKGDFPTRVPKKESFTEYEYHFVDGTKCVISREELSAEVDELMYEELKNEANNNTVQIEKHRAFSKDNEKNDLLFNSKPSDMNVEEAVINLLKKDELIKAVNMLQPQQKELIVKKYILKISNAELARMEGVTETAVWNRLHRIHKQLKNIMLKEE